MFRAFIGGGNAASFGGVPYASAFTGDGAARGAAAFAGRGAEWYQKPNDNLLVNPRFQINQRKQELYSGNVAIVDGWRAGTRFAIVNVLENGIHVETTSDAGIGQFMLSQKIENHQNYANHVITFSAYIDNMTSGDFQLVVVENTNSRTYSDHITPGFNGVMYATHKCSSDPTDLLVVYRSTVAGVTSFDTSASKLEIGDHQTLAHEDGEGNWVFNDPPPNPAENLAACLRHQYAGSADARAVWYNANTIHFTVSTPVTMRAVPRLAVNGLKVLNLAGAEQTGFTFSVAGCAGNAVTVAATKTNHRLADARLTGAFLFDANI